MIRHWLVALAVLGSAAGPRVPAGPAGSCPGAIRRLELLYPGSFRLTLIASKAGSVAVDAAGPAGPGTILSQPGDAVSFRKAPGDPAATATWQLAFLPGAGSGCDLDLEWSDEGGTLKVPFRVRTREQEPRVEVTLRPGSFDQLRNDEGRSYYVKGPVTIVGATAEGDVLIAVTE